MYYFFFFFFSFNLMSMYFEFQNFSFYLSILFFWFCCHPYDICISLFLSLLSYLFTLSIFLSVLFFLFYPFISIILVNLHCLLTSPSSFNSLPSLFSNYLHLLHYSSVFLQFKNIPAAFYSSCLVFAPDVSNGTR